MKTINDLLAEKGFIEGTDYEIKGGEILALPKIKQVYEHPELGEDDIPVDITYYETLPTMALMEIELENYKLSTIPDLMLAISEYLTFYAPEMRDEDDNLNVDTVIHRWEFKNIPKPTYAELAVHYQNAATRTSEVRSLNAKLARGKAMRDVCENVLNLVAAENEDSSQSDSYKTQMSITFAPIVQQLLIIRPGKAKQLIEAIDPKDDTYLKSLKEKILALFKEF